MRRFSPCTITRSKTSISTGISNSILNLTSAFTATSITSLTSAYSASTTATGTAAAAKFLLYLTGRSRFATVQYNQRHNHRRHHHQSHSSLQQSPTSFRHTTQATRNATRAARPLLPRPKALTTSTVSTKLALLPPSTRPNGNPKHISAPLNLSCLTSWSLRPRTSANMAGPPRRERALSFHTTQRRRVSTPFNTHLLPDFLGNRRARQQRLSSSSSVPNLKDDRSFEESPAWSSSSSESEDSEEANVPITPATTEGGDGELDDGRSLPPSDALDLDLTKAFAKPAATQLISNDADFIEKEQAKAQRRNSRGVESGAQLVRKYCCGGGCCFVNDKAPLSQPISQTPLELPDNDAFRSLALKLGDVGDEADLLDITALPESTISFSPLPVSQQPSSPIESSFEPPSFVQPHPPYNIFSAPLYHARELTKPGAEKRTFHFDIDITDYPIEGGVDFKVGGAIGVCPANYPEAVEDIFDTLGVPRFIRDKPVLMTTTGGRWPTIWGEEKPRELVTTRRQVLTWCSDVQSYPPTKAFLRLLADHATAANERRILLYLASAQGQPAFCSLRTGPLLSVAQILHAFPSSKPPFDHLLSLLSTLTPRFYSLSNDPHVSSERDYLAGRRLIEVAVSVHSRPNWRGGNHHGVGSGFMERLAKRFMQAESSAKARGLSHDEACEEARRLDIRVPMFRGLMANPLSTQFSQSTGPMMLIGAGVGMAPFRGFILNRLRNANCASKIWLVQGIRDAKFDELYSGELGKYEAQIKRVVQSRASRRRLDSMHKANSEVDLAALKELSLKRTGSNGQTEIPDWIPADTAESRYVQDELRHQADIVWDVIRNIDGRIFVCGSSKGMGEGVEQALREVAMQKGGFDLEGATHFWNEQKEVGKYIAETW